MGVSQSNATQDVTQTSRDFTYSVFGDQTNKLPLQRQHVAVCRQQLFEHRQQWVFAVVRFGDRLGGQVNTRQHVTTSLFPVGQGSVEGRLLAEHDPLVSQ
ncbi:hypothetical protein D3C86_1530640 [compost metagenome]